MKRSLKNKTATVYGAAVIFVLLSAVLGVLLGSSDVGAAELLSALFDTERVSAASRILWYVRIPRVAASLLCGAALAVSGALIQGVLANRLASPSVIGVTSGAGVAVTVCSAFGLFGGFGLSACAFVGALAAVTLVSLGAKKWGASRGTVILMGVALNALLGAVSDTVITLVPEAAMMQSDFRIGDFSAVTYQRLVPAAILILIGIAVALLTSDELDALSLGDERARSIGMNTGRTRALLLILSALLAGAAVSVAGLLSFVGLLVPHAVRRVAGTRSRRLLPLCALFGAGFVTLCDTLARVLLAPYELPVGIIMAFLGAPFFIFILVKGKGGHGNA